MIRYCGAALGCLAFAVTIVIGLVSQVPVETTLVRAIQALFLFAVLGLFVGWVAHRVIDEHAVQRNEEMFASFNPPTNTEQETPTTGDA